MKKLLIILVALLWCNVGVAELPGTQERETAINSGGVGIMVTAGKSKRKAETGWATLFFNGGGNTYEEAVDNTMRRCKNDPKVKKSSKLKCYVTKVIYMIDGVEKVLFAGKYNTSAHAAKLAIEKYRKQKKIASGDLTFTIKDKKEQCEAIGFEPQTEKFADCVLRLVELDVKSQQANQIALAESQGNQQVADELRKQRNQQGGQYLMDLGQKLLNPPTRKTTRCTVTGVGSFKTVSCR